MSCLFGPRNKKRKFVSIDNDTTYVSINSQAMAMDTTQDDVMASKRQAMGSTLKEDSGYHSQRMREVTTSYKERECKGEL